ncbi:MAG: hypothetical protein R2729_11180 [Bryobacteraceae bacterium]
MKTAMLSLVLTATVAAQIKLPPGLTQTLPVAPAGSYFGDAVRFADCPLDKDNPLGVCGNTLFGGYGMYLSQLTGDVRVRFFEPVRGVAHFEIEFPSGLRGSEATMAAPLHYRYPVSATTVSSSIAITKGDVDMNTGEIKNLVMNLDIRNSFVEATVALNPNFRAGAIVFPYVEGTAIGKFENREDGLLDLTLFASTFVPMNNQIDGERVRMPYPGRAADGSYLGFEAPGSSLRPRLRLTTKASADVECGSQCPEIPLNTVRELSGMPFRSSLGDAFELDIPELGGGAVGRAHLQGRVEVQFGERYGDVVPVAFWALLPGAMLAEPPPSPLAGFTPNMLGHDERVRFPNFTYQPKNVALASDPFDTSVGILDLRTGRLLSDFVYRGVPAQDLFFTIFELNAGRIPGDTFRWRGPAKFERGQDGGLTFTFSGDVFLDFSTFLFPEPDYNPARVWRAGPQAVLNPFLNLQGHLPGPTPGGQMNGGFTGATSSFGDTISISYSIPCTGEGVSRFEFTNGANATRGGTFRMQNLAFVSCFNSRRSTLAAGSFDSINFTGYGTWSKDDEIHLATVHVSQAEGESYWSVQIDGGLVSNANNKPPQDGQFVGNSVGPPPP